MKIVYLVEQPLDERNYERFGLQVWLDRGWSVEVWDLTPIAYPKVWATFLESRDRFQRSAVHFPIGTWRDLRRRLTATEKPACFVDFSGNHFWSVLARLALVRSNAVRMLAHLGAIPDFREPPARGRRKSIAGQFAKPLSRAMTEAGYLVSQRLAKPGVIIVSGATALRHACSLGYSDRIVRAHNFDFDLYMRLKAGENAESRKRRDPYAVFMDQDLCFHPEYLFARRTPYVSAEKYFPSMRRALKRIAAALDMDVVVAAHPRASYDAAKYFGDIPVEKHRTADLVRDAALVVCHSSTSLQLGILFNKPIIFLTTDELASSSIGEYVENFARLLSKKAVNVDDVSAEPDWRTEMVIDAAAYAAYRNEYIKTDGSEEEPLWTIVAGAIENRLRIASPSMARK